MRIMVELQGADLRSSDLRRIEAAIREVIGCDPTLPAVYVNAYVPRSENVQLTADTGSS